MTGRGAAFCLIAVALAAPAAAQTAGFAPERRALFVSILEDHDCRMHNLAPTKEIVAAIQAAEFTRDELRAIARDLLESGDGAREGEELVLKTGKCA